MTQTAQQPVQLTLETMVAKFRGKHHDLTLPFEKLRPELEAGTGAQALANLIACKVDLVTEQESLVYRWTGQNNPFELRIPKPFDPHPQHSGEMQQQAQVQEAETTAQTTQEGSEPAGDPPAPAEQPHPLRKTLKPWRNPLQVYFQPSPNCWEIAPC